MERRIRIGLSGVVEKAALCGSGYIAVYATASSKEGVFVDIAAVA